jgi:hypothetical protein
MEKSVNLMLEDEIAKLRQALINSVNSAALPVSVKKLVIDGTARDILAALQKMIDKERTELAQEPETEDKGENDNG